MDKKNCIDLGNQLNKKHKYIISCTINANNHQL